MKSVFLMAMVLVSCVVLAQDGPDDRRKRVRVFSDTRYARSPISFDTTFDQDRVDYVRDFTGEALFASGKDRLNRELTKEELRSIARLKEQTDTFNGVVLHLQEDNVYPYLKIGHRYREEQKSQITHFYAPQNMNDVVVNETMVALYGWNQWLFPQNETVFFNTTYKRIEQQGTIEFLPLQKEAMNFGKYEVLVKEVAGWEGTQLEWAYASFDINQDVANPITRARDIWNVQFTKYEICAGLDVTVGYVTDEESWAGTDITKDNVFLGFTWKDVWSKPVDVIWRPTVFSYGVNTDHDRNNSQCRNELMVRYKITPRLNVEMPVSHDLALSGPNDFENFKVGLRLSTQIFSIEYGYQRFYDINENDTIFLGKVHLAF